MFRSPLWPSGRCTAVPIQYNKIAFFFWLAAWVWKSLWCAAMEHNKLKGNLRSYLYTHFHSYHISPYYHSFLSACPPPSLSSSSRFTLVSLSFPSVFYLLLFLYFHRLTSLLLSSFPYPTLPSILSPCTSPFPLHVLTYTVFHVPFIIFYCTLPTPFCASPAVASFIFSFSSSPS